MFFAVYDRIRGMGWREEALELINQRVIISDPGFKESISRLSSKEDVELSKVQKKLRDVVIYLQELHDEKCTDNEEINRVLILYKGLIEIEKRYYDKMFRDSA